MTEPSKPQAVRKAVALLWFSLVVAVVGTCAWLYTSEIPIHIGTIFSTSRTWIGFVVSAVLTHSISTGKNWARIIFALSLAYGAVMTTLGVILDANRFPFLIALGVGLVLVQIYATYLLFSRASNDWFRPSVATA